MITRPLDLASRLRPPPLSFDWVFFVNAGAIVAFFIFFGSPFVLAPALGVEFRVPRMEGASVDPAVTRHVLNVTNAGQLLVRDGSLQNMAQLRDWLKREASTEKNPALLIIADERVPLSLATEISGAARSMGFSTVKFSAEEPAAGRAP